MHHDHEHEGCCHSHEEGHAHEHHHEHGCAACGSCNADPKAELKALMKYMVGHHASHANELAQLAAKLKELGEDTAYEQIMLAVSDFEKGNMRLSTVLAAMEYGAITVCAWQTSIRDRKHRKIWCSAMCSASTSKTVRSS